jgi:hypothetical protein
VFNRSCHTCGKKFQSKIHPQAFACTCLFEAFNVEEPLLLYQEDIDKAERIVEVTRSKEGLDIRKIIAMISHFHAFDGITLKKILWLPNKYQQTFINLFIQREEHLICLLRTRTELIEPLFLGALLKKKWSFFKRLL